MMPGSISAASVLHVHEVLTCWTAGVQTLAQEAADGVRQRCVVFERVQLLRHRVSEQDKRLLGWGQRPPKAPS